MKIIYNPPNGSKIEDFIYQNIGKLKSHEVGEVKQYDPAVGQRLLETFPFLQEITAKKAEEILAKPKIGEFKCEYCEFSSNYKLALAGHMRSHTAEIAKETEPAIDPNIIPVAEATPVEPLKSISDRHQDDLTIDAGYYGPGLTESR